MSEAVLCDVLDFGLHNSPEKLNKLLQEKIDNSVGVETIVLGYGLCSKSVIGLKATHCPLVVPVVDDCIGLIMGSTEKYRQMVQNEPGTYYFTKGWIDVCDSPFEEFKRLKHKYGIKKANIIMDMMLKHYTRLTFINTGNYNVLPYRKYVQETAENFGLEYTEIMGTTTWLNKMIHGPWDDDFIVVPKGQTILFDDFKKLREL